ncbi:MAG TPA: hypothetical protein VK324_08450 [Tepidisphaeraceae bacterium]|nr:hypothetical protein [Tepidisphaeraceae bacterium]
MITVKHIERVWTARQYDRLLKELLSARPEATVRLEAELAGSLPAAALAVVRLDELGQSHVPLYATLVRAILAAQNADGGWTDPMQSALCLRALLCGRGHGEAIDRGLFYLATMQKSEGVWPAIPFRRMPADPFASAFILLQLGDQPKFRAAVRFFDALDWFEQHEHTLEASTRKLWDRAASRCRLRVAGVDVGASHEVDAARR